MVTQDRLDQPARQQRDDRVAGQRRSCDWQKLHRPKRAVVLGGIEKGQDVDIGNNVTAQRGAPVVSSTVGDGATIAARSYVSKSTIPPGGSVSPGTILFENNVVGTVEW